LGRFAIGARVALIWQHNANPSYKLTSIPRYDDIVRTAGWAGSARAAGRRPAGDGGRPQNHAPHTGSRRGRPAAGGAFSILLRQSGLRASTGGVLATKSATQNVSEYVLVLALCLVINVWNSLPFTLNFTSLINFKRSLDCIDLSVH